ncbi:MAG: hypothetical protein VX409_02925, partial [Verrucomicrobiota bacterium]|nr:hypothetical protein [Verrucomicrobiota bacterium]
MRNKKHLTFITTVVFLSLYLPSIPAEKSRYTEPYPTAKSKKGLQVEIVEDALSLGVKHAALNFNLSQLIDPDCNPNNPMWMIDGN